MPRQKLNDSNNLNNNFTPATVEQKSLIEHRIASIRELNAELVNLFFSTVSPFLILHGGMFFLKQEGNIFSYVQNSYKKPIIENALRSSTLDQGYVVVADNPETGYQNVITFGGGMGIVDRYAESNNPDVIYNQLIESIRDFENSGSGGYRSLGVSNQLEMIKTFGEVSGSVFAENYLSIALSILSPLFYYLLFPPFANRISRLLSNRQLANNSEAMLSALSAADADEMIEQLNLINLSAKRWFYSSAVSISSMAFFLLSLSAVLVAENGQLSYESIGFIATFFVAQCRNGFKLYQKQQAQERLMQELTAAKNSMNKAISVTNGSCVLHKGFNLRDSYFIFNASEKYQSLSPETVNQVVKDVLFKNGISITDFSTRKLSFGISKLTNVAADKIKLEITQYLQSLVAIKKLSMQVYAEYPVHEIVKTVILVNDLPVANYFITLNLKEKNDVAEVRALFNRCIVTATENGISICGNQPYPPQPKVKAKAPVVVLATESAKPGTKFRKLTAKKLLETNSSIEPIPAASKSKEVTQFKWSAGTYRSDDPDCRIKAINHPAFSKHFVLFSIPEDRFPTGVYQHVKNKVEEGKMATNKQAQQGLQVRAERAYDETRREWFISSMRCKLVGDSAGNVRVFAREERNEDGATLHIFRGRNLSEH
jgi:hypothetical protein